MTAAPAASPAKPAPRLLPPLAGALIVLAAGLALSWTTSRLLDRHFDDEVAERLEARGSQLGAHLERRLDDLRNLIYGLQGLFIASERVTRGDFRRYSETLHLTERLGGLQAISFQRRVSHADKPAFLAQVRADRSRDASGYPDFAIRPPGERAEYLVIDYIEPLAANRAAFGFDAATQAGNADAIRRARDTGDMRVSEPFMIAQSPDGPPRIVLRAPVYRRGAPAGTIEERGAALTGFVVLTVETRASFNDYFRALLQEGETVLIEDAGPANAPAVNAPGLIAQVGPGGGTARLEQDRTLAFGGRSWRLRHSVDSAWVAAQSGHGHGAMALGAGAVVSTLLAVLYFVLASARRRAWQMVAIRTRDLRQSEERFRTATELSSEWYWQQDADYRFTLFVGKAREATGIPTEHFLGKTRWTAAPGLMSEAQWAAHRADLDAHRPFTLVYAVRRGDEALCWVETKGQARFDEQGSFLGYHGTARDITRNVEAENRLTEQARLLRAVLEHMNQGISVVDAQLRLVGCNRRFIELLGFPEELFREGTPFEDFVRFNAQRGEYGPGDIEALVHARVDLARRFLPHRFKRARPDGRVLDIIGTPLPGGGMVTTYTDITEQARAEQALREGEARLRRIIEQSPLSMAIVGLDGRIELINRKAVETFGYPPEDIPDMARWWAQAYPDPAYREAVVSQWMGLVQEAIAGNHEIAPRPYRVTRKDGRVITAEIFGVPVADKVLVMFQDVTEREIGARRVQQERDFRQHIIESIPGVFYLISPDGRFLLWNRNFERVTGYDAQAMAGASPLDFFDGADKERIAQRIGAVFESGTATAEAPFRTADGSMRPYFFTGERITLEDGNPGLVGVGFDISERTRAEEALARQSAILQATLEAMDQGISVVDADLRMTALNKRFCELLDFPEEMAIGGARFADFARYNALRGEYGPCDVEEKVREMVERARHPAPHHFRRTRPNGRILEVRGNPLPGGGFVTTYTDITDEEHAQALVQRERDLRQRLIESVPGIFFLFDAGGHFLLWNHNLEDFLGVDGKEVAHRRTIELYDPADREIIRQATRSAFANGSASVEAMLVAPGGRRVPYLITGLRIELEDGPAIVGLGVDISERKHIETVIRDLNESLEQRVRERTAELEESNRELESFSYSVSHDLRAPLRALHGFSHLLAEEYAHKLDQTGLGYLRRIQIASERMGTLIDDLIELARISRKELKKVDVDLSALAQELAATLAEQAPQRAVVWDIAPDLRAQADPVLARALLDNLMRNAWKFTAERAEARIQVGRHRDGRTDAFYVRDNGAGFDMTYAGKLFQPFQRLHDAHRFEGTGIGLAIVQRIVRRHGGRIWAEGTPDAGATFHFTLS